MNDLIRDETTRSYWVISILALFWNLLGVMTYLVEVTLTAEDLAAMSEVDRALRVATPGWVTGAYAIAVFGGLLGSIGLLLRKTWAAPVFAVALIAIVVQMGYAMLFTDAIALKGATVVALPLTITAIGAYLLYFARDAKSRGILA